MSHQLHLSNDLSLSELAAFTQHSDICSELGIMTDFLHCSNLVFAHYYEQYILILADCYDRIVRNKEQKRFVGRLAMNECRKQILTMRDNLKLLREESQLTLEDLSAKTGICQEILVAMEGDKNFGIEYLLRLCQYYRIDPSMIFHPFTIKM